MALSFISLTSIIKIERKMPKARVGDINMYYEVHGAGEPLVLIHGLGLDSSSWMPQIMAFSKKFKVVIFDNRGVGRTDAPKYAYSTAMMADDTVALLDAIGIGKAHILGLSLGGLISQEIAIRYPERLKSLILATTAATLSPLATHIIKVWQIIIEMEADPETVMRERFLWVFTDKFFENYEQVTSLIKMFMNHPYPQPVHGFAGQAAACIRHDSLNRLGKITVPTLVLVGREDIFIPVKLSEVLAANISSAEMLILDNGGHGFSFEISGRFNQAVMDFLARVEKQT